MRFSHTQLLIFAGMTINGLAIFETNRVMAAELVRSSSLLNSPFLNIPLPPRVRVADERLITRMILHKYSERRSRYLSLMKFFAKEHSIPMILIDTVIRVESAYVSTAVGGVGEIGLMQVRPTTASLLGFRGSNAQLSKPQTNIRYGSLYLAQAWRLAKGDLCRTLMKYRAGHGETRMSKLSKYYCYRAKKHLAAFSALSQFSSPGNRKEYASLQRLAALYFGMPLNYRRARKSLRRQHPLSYRRGGFLNLRRRVAPAGFMRIR